MTQPSDSAAAFNDSLNFVKKLWGQMGVPGMQSMPGMTIPGMATMAVPSMSVEDLDKRIQELKTVESWLNVNMTMLRNTIQAMEVQRATIATLHSLSSTMTKTMQGMGSGEAMNPFSARPAAKAEPEQESQPESPADSQAKSDEEVSPLIAQSAAWWHNVQDQFKQALGTALEKSTANFDAVRTASEEMVQAVTPQKTADAWSAPKAAAARPASKPAASTKSAAKPAAKKKTVAKARPTPGKVVKAG